MIQKEVYEILKKNFRGLEQAKAMMCSDLPREAIPNLYINLGTEIYTCAREIWVGAGFPVFADCKDEDEVITFALYVIEHEVLHNYYTPDKAWKYGISAGARAVYEGLAPILDPSRKWNFNNSNMFRAFDTEMLKKGYVVGYGKIVKFCHMVQNSFEDGRIERIGSEKSVVFDSEKKEGRIKFWKNQELETDADMTDASAVLNVVLGQILMIATTGVPMKGFYQNYRGTPAEEWLHKVENLIGLAFYAPKCKICMDWAIEVEKRLVPLVAEACKNGTLAGILDSMLQYLADKIREGEEAQKGRGVKENEEHEDESQEAQDKYSELEKKENGASGEEDEEEDEKSPDSGKSSGGGSPEDEQDDEGEGKGSAADAEKDLEDELEEAKEANKRVASDMQEANRLKEQQTQRDVKDGKKPSSKEPRKKVTEEYEAKEGKIHYWESDTEIKQNYPTPGTILKEGESLRRKIEDIFIKDKAPVLYNQKSGILRGSQAWMLRGGESEIFKKKVDADIRRMAFYILQDNSGSMGDGQDSKRYYACTAAGIVEEALRNEMDHISLKVAAFDSNGWNDVRHKRIKDWDDWPADSCCNNYFVNEESGGGNKDGFSIRVATEELLERTEEEKYLIIISDGAPTCYRDGYNAAQADTGAAVSYAREHGIRTVGLFLSENANPSEDSCWEIFKGMYKRDCSFVRPDNIADVLADLLCQVCDN